MARRPVLEIEGLEELKDTLGDFLPREANNILRRTITKVAANIRDDMRKEAPKDEGVLRKAITSRRNRGTPDSIEAGVYITHGKKVRNSAWYWHFLEYGTVNHPADPFIYPTAEEWRGKISDSFRHELGPQIEREVEKRAKRRQK